MDVFNKLYSSVTSTVSQLSTVLPGNPLNREYVVTDHVCNAGIGLLWKVFNGYKKSTKEKVSIFLLEKKALEHLSKDREYMISLLKRGVQQLTRIRHPNILTVQHPLEESRDVLVFATEPIFLCLDNLIKNRDIKSKLHDIEIKHGLLQMCEGLSFLHDEMKIVHQSINPQNVIVTAKGSWKIFGFEFCLSGTVDNAGKNVWTFPEYNLQRDRLTQPRLEFIAPEYVLNNSLVSESDVYSFGTLIYCIYMEGNAFQDFRGNFKNLRQFFENLNRGQFPNFQNVPDNLQNALKGLIHPSPNIRLKLTEFKNVAFFDDTSVKTLLYLSSLHQWNNLERSKFYKGLVAIIPSIPKRVNLMIVMSALVQEFVNLQMIPFILPNIFLIAESCDKDDFEKYILHFLLPAFKLEDPVQISYILLKNMDIIIKMFPTKNIQDDVLPMLYRILESNNSQTQEICLKDLPKLFALVENDSIKNSVLPKIQNLCLRSQVVSVKVSCLMCVRTILEKLDKWTVSDKIIPFLIKIECRDSAVIMALIEIIKITLANPKLGITQHILATKILPFLMPLCVVNGLSINQLNQIVSLIKNMVDSVETEQRSKLEKTEKMHDVARSNLSAELNSMASSQTVLVAERLPSLASTQIKNLESKKTDVTPTNQFDNIFLDVNSANQFKQIEATTEKKSLYNNYGENKILQPEYSEKKLNNQKINELSHQDILDFLK